VNGASLHRMIPRHYRSTNTSSGHWWREGKRDEALSLLREVIDHGLPPSLGLGIENDSDLQSLHGDPRFDAIVAHAKERAAAAEKKQ